MKRVLFLALSSVVLLAVFMVLGLIQDYQEQIEALNQEIAALQNQCGEYEIILAEKEEEAEMLVAVVENRQRTLEMSRGGRRVEEPAIEIISLAHQSQPQYQGVISSSGLTPEMFETAWKNLGRPNMAGSGVEFLAAEDETGIHALILAAIAYHETGGGESAIAKDKNNFYGFNAWGPDPYARALIFESRGAGTMHVAKFLKSHYLSEDGPYFNGYTIDAIGIRYAEDPLWAEKVKRIACMILDNMEIDIEMLMSF